MRRSTLVLLAIFLLVTAAPPALAQSGGGNSTPNDAGYDLSWWTVDGGGATFNTGGGYSLGSTAGQPDAAVWAGDDYTLAGGFWGGVAVEYRVFLPMVMQSF